MKRFINFVRNLFLLIIFFWFGLAADRNLPWIDIISRQQRGADESFRYYSWQVISAPIDTSKEQYLNEVKEVDSKDLNRIRANYQKEVANNYLISNYPNESKVDWFNQYFGDKRLKRTESVKTNKTKLVVHHTAMNSSWIKNQSDAIKEIQNIYKYHAINRWRWDIWYNFIIDPFGNIYEWRAGWEWVVWAHIKRNNSSSVWITVLWNFDEQKLSPEALKSLINLLSALSKKYNINPYSKIMYHKDLADFPYIQHKEWYAIWWHADWWNTACPWDNIYTLLPQIRKQIADTLNNNSSVTNTSSTPISEKLISYITNKWDIRSQLTYVWAKQLREQMQKSIQQMKEKYWTKKLSSKSISKTVFKITKDEAKALVNWDISVLLYDLTFDFDKYQISCLWSCSFDLNSNIYNSAFADISIINDQIVLKIWSESYVWDNLTINSSKGLIAFRNYFRKSYYSKPWNVFRWKIFIKNQPVKDKNWKQSNRFAVINKLSFTDYMKWIVETNDSESVEKNKVMSLISKSYAIFYLKNTHPNIPSWSDYNAVDDPAIFQKYVWAWAEITLKKRPKALDSTKNILVTFDWYVPILPYFNCSPWFTYSAQEKWWRNDTPYLISNLDIASCKDFNWHWVGMSGKWAEYRATKWWNYKEILDYYYPWISIDNF